MTRSTIPLTLTPESSQIHGYGYDPASQTLAVKFNSNHKEVTYHYLQVPPTVAATLEAAPSKGVVIYKQIKPAFEFNRLSEQEPQEQEQA